jgi:dienelactone hydrolase
MRDAISVALFHSVLGCRPGFLQFADQLHSAGHEVHPIDIFNGVTFASLGEGLAMRDSIGIPELIRRATDGVNALPTGTVYVGFSMGASIAQYFAAVRTGSRGAVLMSGADDPADSEIDGWPHGVPVQVHYAIDDSWIDHPQVDALAKAVTAAGASFECHIYPGSGHLFADPELPEYDGRSANLMLKRTLDFLDRL